MRRVEGGKKGGIGDRSLVSRFGSVLDLASQFRHSIIRATTLQTLGSSITSGYHNSYPSQCRLYVMFHAMCIFTRDYRDKPARRVTNRATNL